MKTCSKCFGRKPLSAYAKNASKRDGRSHVCKLCQRQYAQEHYAQNKEYYLGKAKVHRQRALEAAQALVRGAKDVPCSDCKGRYPYYVMDFDHVQGVKISEIAKLQKGASLRKIRAEIAKCEVVCANCHRIRTHNRSHS